MLYTVAVLAAPPYAVFGSTCTTDATNPCSVSCKSGAPCAPPHTAGRDRWLRSFSVWFAGAYDLSGFAKQMTGTYFHAVDADTHDYYFMACGPITAVTCPVTPTIASPVAVQTWGDPAPTPPSFYPDSCAPLGTATSASCVLLCPAPPPHP
jgi:hypothetical protein